MGLCAWGDRPPAGQLRVTPAAAVSGRGALVKLKRTDPERIGCCRYWNAAAAGMLQLLEFSLQQ
jgi:hypothetical protein